MSKEDKRKLSYLENPCRRGYEASGISLRDGDAMPASKEVRALQPMNDESFPYALLYTQLIAD